MGRIDAGIVHDGDDVARHFLDGVDAGRLGALARSPVIVEDDGPFLGERLRLKGPRSPRAVQPADEKNRGPGRVRVQDFVINLDAAGVDCGHARSLMKNEGIRLINYF